MYAAAADCAGAILTRIEAYTKKVYLSLSNYVGKRSDPDDPQAFIPTRAIRFDLFLLLRRSCIPCTAKNTDFLRN